MRKTRLIHALLMFGAIVAFAANAGPVLEGKTERPLRYTPQGTDFVIENGPERFNRPLYIRNSAMRVDAGDQAEFSLYLPGRGGNLRLGFRAGGDGAEAKWFDQAKQRVARYRPAEMVYEIRDSALGELTVELLTLASADGYIVRVDAKEVTNNAELVFAYGGANGDRGRRNGDIGCEPVPVSQFFALKPDYCRDNVYAIERNRFVLTSKPATLVGIAPQGAKLQPANAQKWDDAAALLASVNEKPATPVIVGTAKLQRDKPLFIVIQKQGDETDP